MASFTDANGRNWVIAINVAVIKRVRAALETDLLKILEGGLLERLIADPVHLVDVLYVVCQKQAVELGVSEESFGAAMAGDPIEAATKGLLEELVLFFPSPSDRANLKRVLELTYGAMDKARAVIRTRLEDGTVDAAIEQALRSAGGPSGPAPAPAA